MCFTFNWKLTLPNHRLYIILFVDIDINRIIDHIFIRKH